MSLLNVLPTHSTGRHSVDGHSVTEPHVRDVEDATAFITEREERRWTRSRDPHHLSLRSEFHVRQVAGKQRALKKGMHLLGAHSGEVSIALFWNFSILNGPSILARASVLRVPSKPKVDGAKCRKG